VPWDKLTREGNRTERFCASSRSMIFFCGGLTPATTVEHAPPRIYGCRRIHLDRSSSILRQLFLRELVIGYGLRVLPARVLINFHFAMWRSRRPDIDPAQQVRSWPFCDLRRCPLLRRCWRTSRHQTRLIPASRFMSHALVKPDKPLVL
jgi:hypothetical protein